MPDVHRVGVSHRNVARVVEVLELPLQRDDDVIQNLDRRMPCVKEAQVFLQWKGRLLQEARKFS